MKLRGEALELLAGAQVLGTTSLRVRRRFEHLMARDPVVRQAHDRWQQRLAGLAGWEPPVRPDPRTLPALLARVQGRRRPWWGLSTQAFPRTLAAALLGACLALGGVLYVLKQQPVLTAHVEDAQGEALWRFAAPADASRLAVTVLRQGLVPQGRALEIWALPEGGKAVSLGLVPAAHDTVLALNDAQRRALGAATRIAITLEPPGGSPTGVATGPILHVVALNRRS
jgi:anti-sigma-K factor RskA